MNRLIKFLIYLALFVLGIVKIIFHQEIVVGIIMLLPMIALVVDEWTLDRIAKKIYEHERQDRS